MAHLEFLNGAQTGELIPLSPDHPCSLGRDGASEVTIKEPAVEDVHCVIKVLKDGGYGLKDLDSGSGTFVNEKKISAVRLRDRDVIRVGTTRLRFAERAESRVEPPPPPAERPAPRQQPAPAEQPGSSKHALPPARQPAPEPASPQPRRAEVRRDQSDLPPGTEIGGYRIEEKLGQGGMGTVYRTTQLSLGRQVALKLLSVELTRDPAFVARFVEEARAAGRFNHPNVVQVYDVGNVGDLYYYSMELVEHGSIEERIRKEGTIAHPDATRIVRDAARGLAYAESLKVVHRDIKPDNLMSNRLGITKIADLGLATDLEQGKGTQGSVFGTPHFISPEQALGKPVDGRSDLYSLGCTWYRMLTGKTPFSGDTVKEILRQQIKEDPKPVRELVPAVPEKVSALIVRLMKKNPDERFATASELLEEVDAILGGGRRRGGLIAAVVVAVIAVGVTIVLLNREPEQITTIVERTDPNAKKTALQLRESQADGDYLRIDRSLPDQDRLVALTRVAEEHRDTEFVKKTVEPEIEQLRGKIARDEAARKARAEAVAGVVAGLAAAIDEPLSRSDFAGAEKALAQVPALDQHREEPGVVQALAAANQRIASAAETHLRSLLDGVPGLLAQGKVPEADAILSRVRTAVSDQALSAELRSALAPIDAKTTELTAAARAKAAELEAATLAAALATWRAGLFDGDGVMPALAELRTPDALVRSKSLATALAGTPYAPAAGRLAALVERAAAFHAKFVAATAESFAADSFPLPDEGEAVLLSSDAAKGIRVTTDRKARNRKEEWWPWQRFADPASLTSLFGAERVALTEQDRPDRAAFLGLVGLAQPLAAARAYQARPSATPPSLSTAALEAAVAAAGPETVPGAAQMSAWLTGELAALKLLAAGLAAVGAERHTEALVWLSRLAEKHQGSLTFAAVSRPDSSCLPK